MGILNYIERNLCFFIEKYFPKNLEDIIKDICWKFKISSESRLLLKKYSNVVKKDYLIFDIGGNRGNHSLIFLMLGVKKIILLEPNPDLIYSLKKRFKGKNVEIINNGVSSKRGFFYFNILEDSGHSTFVEYCEKEVLKRRIKVKTIRLSDLIKKYGIPDFIKIDVEGFEWEVLKTLTKKVKGIVFENSCIENSKKCLIHLNTQGEYLFATDSQILNKNWESYKKFLKNINSYKKGSNIFAKLIVRKNKLSSKISEQND